MSEKKIFIFIIDSLTNLKIAYVILELNNFFRQGKKDQVQFLSLPLFFMNELSDEISHDNRNFIGEVKMIVINKVNEGS